MKIAKTTEEFIAEIDCKRQLIIYGAGTIGKAVCRILKNQGRVISALAVTMQAKDRELEGIPVRTLDDILSNYLSKDITIILAVTDVHLNSMKTELEKRKISSYIELSQALIYELIRQDRKFLARKAEVNKTKNVLENTVGYLSPGYLDTDYAEQRLIINKIYEAVYKALPKETAEITLIGTDYENNLDRYKQLVEACYLPKEYIPEVKLIHTFNTVCDTDRPWCASFETTIPRIWPETEEETAYYLSLVECMKKENCRRLYAFCENAYKIQEHSLRQYLSGEDVESLMEKTKILHPPQEVLVTEEEFFRKYKEQKFHFIFIGRGFFFKGGREIIKTLSRFENQYEFKLTLISSLDYNDYFTRTSYEEMIRWKEIIQKKEWIDYYESLPNIDVLEKCKQANIGLLPSVADTYGYSVLEMQASGCPVITTNIRAFPEINNEECGWICSLPINELRCCGTPMWSEILEKELERVFLKVFEHPNGIKEKGWLALQRIKKMHDPCKYQRELQNNLLYK
ncbi:MAG: glycosyltransferase [Lachnospiraceae bacterium]|jgi:glycosyltransferase involved in cell wall biosynthesis|nr:glycosyltransferase [Lachnospiraceae bacterium]